MFARGNGVGGMDKIGEREWEIQFLSMEWIRHDNKNYSIGNTDNDIVTTFYDDRW